MNNSEIDNLISLLARLPGIGPRSARRMALNFLKKPESLMKPLAESLITTANSIKIFGNPDLSVNKKILIKDYLKDHRVFMTSVVAALTFGGEWVINDSDSIKTSFPSFLRIINNLKK